MDDTERARQGTTVRRAVLGDEHVDRAVAATTPFTEPFQDLITRYAWGEIWSRPGLSRAERSIVTLTVLAALQHETELAMHVKAALRNGLSPDQISEVLLQVTVYAGVPVGNRAFAVARRALAEAGEDELPGRAGPVYQPPFWLLVCFLAIAPLAAELASCHSPSSDLRTSVLLATVKTVSFS